MNTTFGYDGYGDQIRSSYYDSVTGVLKVQSAVTQQDDQGRPLVTTSLDNGQISTETDTYTQQGDLGSEIFGSVGNTAVTYGYDSSNNTAGTAGGDADALSSITASTPGEQSVSQGDTYDSAGRLSTITVNGVTLTYHYLGDSDQIETITAGNLTTTFTPLPSDGSLLQGINVTAASQSLYNGLYTYNADDQRATDSISRTDAIGNATSQSLDYTYDPNLANALTQVKDGSNNVLYSYSYDAAGDFLGNATLGTANSVNEYSNLTYNARHDLTNDGTEAYGYDALDRLISVTPDNPASGSVSAQFGYDSQGRMLWENVYTWAGYWTLSTTYHFVWSGDELIEKLDANDKVLQQYTWGPGWNGTDQVIALTDFTSTNPHTYTLSYDASGNVSMLLDPATGAVAATYAYAPYGALVSSTGNAAINPWLGKGYWTDAVAPGIGWAQPDTADGAVRETKFTFGLWLEDDPTGFDGGLNPNSVDGNDPINFSDPDGTYPIPSTLTTPPPSTGADPGEMLQRALAARRAVASSGATTPAQIDEAVNNSYSATGRLQAATINANFGNITPPEHLWNAVSGFPEGYWATLIDGQQSDAFFGYWDGLTNAVSAGHGSNYGTTFGYQSDYETGRTMGEGAGFVINAAVTVSGFGGVVKGIETVAAGGGLLHMAAVALNDGRLVLAISVKGQAVIATAETLISAGMSADAAANVLYQVKNSGGGGSGPKGGEYGTVRDANDGGQVHHTPAAKVTPYPYKNAPAVWMETADHYKTASWGSSEAAQAYRQRQAALISQGRLREAVQMDIDDIRAKFGSKYDANIREMLNSFGFSE